MLIVVCCCDDCESEPSEIVVMTLVRWWCDDVLLLLTICCYLLRGRWWVLVLAFVNTIHKRITATPPIQTRNDKKTGEIHGCVEPNHYEGVLSKNYNEIKRLKL